MIRSRAHTHRIEDRERRLKDYFQQEWLRRWQPNDDTPVQ